MGLPGAAGLDAEPTTWLLRSGVTLLVAGCRCGPLLLSVPFLGVAGRLAALCLGLLLVGPLLSPAVAAAGLFSAALTPLGASLLPLCMRELLIGGTLTLAAALPWAVARSTGALLDGVRDASGQRSPRSRGAADLYGALALALFFALGGARTVLTALAASYELLPLASPQPLIKAPISRELGLTGLGLVMLSGRLLWLAIRLALPLLTAQLLAELLVALAERWFGPFTRPNSRWLPSLRSLIWLAVLLLGVGVLGQEFRPLFGLWPALLRQALE